MAEDVSRQDQIMKHDEAVGRRLTDALNRDCHCVAVNKTVLQDSLAAHLRDSALPEKLLSSHSYLFAQSPVFLWEGHVDAMAAVIRAVETVAGSAGYRDAVLATAPSTAAHDFGPRGVFFGYDFHLAVDGPQLIEINTNAGGVLLNMYLAAAQQACCTEVITFFGGTADFASAEAEVMAMFRDEWHAQRGDRPLRSIAIVDAKPKEQFLYPEFLLFQSLFERHGIRAVIADPQDFSMREDSLYVADTAIDLVYNRLTDFYLQTPAAGCLRQAFENGTVVLTPSPRHYALYADKRNLAVMSDAARLRSFGIDDDTIGLLERFIPKTVVVTGDNADVLWQDRKHYFFKPVTGFGSRGTYRGAKLTRKVWDDIVASDYIAQQAVSPSERRLVIDGENQSLKLDIRCVTYRGAVQQLSARLYRGQTTNLRTAGGGLATVFPVPARPAA